MSAFSLCNHGEIANLNNGIDMTPETILLVDHNATPTTIANSLSARGYRVVTVHDANEAIAVAATERPNLVVLNAIEPTANGDRVCRQLKSDSTTRDIRVLMLTGRPTETDMFWGMRQGADAYLSEPFVKDDLISRVSRLI